MKSSQQNKQKPHVWRKTKIIATLGPSSSSKEKIKELIAAGVNVFRLNMSHGSYEQHRKAIEHVRSETAACDLHAAILVDLCGPKLRTGRFEDGKINLKEGQSVLVSCDAAKGKPGLIVSQYKNLYKDVKKGERILLDDGKIELLVHAVKDKKIQCKVVYGGVLKDNKGMNFPDSAISTSSFTSKDKDDVAFAAEMKVDFIALSFVRFASDIKQLKKYIKKTGYEIPIISKIEKPEAVENISGILAESYGIMIARGDLGIELPAQKVPLIQNKLINMARSYNKPVIVATQMLESMITSSRPTRAEVGDVANAALSSADAVMLSAETASGQYPVQAVMVMDSVLREVEDYQWQHGCYGDEAAVDKYSVQASDRKAISHAVTSLASELKLKGIVVPTTNGTTAQVLAADRPTAPLFSVCTDPVICRRMALHWGVVPFEISEPVTGDWKEMCKNISSRCKLTKIGNQVLLVSGFSNDEALNEPVMKIMRI
ncbi:MAG TPA: pyruvate kinase [Gammaproteobacteria bacterium]